MSSEASCMLFYHQNIVHEHATISDIFKLSKVGHFKCLQIRTPTLFKHLNLHGDCLIRHIWHAFSTEHIYNGRGSGLLSREKVNGRVGEDNPTQVNISLIGPCTATSHGPRRPIRENTSSVRLWKNCL